MINTTTLVGRMTKDPELKYGNSGTAICRFTLAVNRNFKTQDGQDADFIQVVCFKKQAENVANFLHKGSLTGVVGRIQTGSYDNKDGVRVFTTEVIADNVQFLEPKGSGQAQQKSDPGAYVPQNDVIDDSSLPF